LVAGQSTGSFSTEGGAAFKHYVTLIADQSTGSYRTEVGTVFKTAYILRTSISLWCLIPSSTVCAVATETGPPYFTVIKTDQACRVSALESTVRRRGPIETGISEIGNGFRGSTEIRR
jgi:hypothetical protein